MSDPPCADLVETYVQWLKEGIQTAEVGGACEITTPFLDRHNDHIQIYVEHKAGGLRLTDDGYILADLEASGVDPFSTPQRADVARGIVQGFGVEVENGELVVDATMEDFPRKKHALLQAMLAINDMFVLARPTVASVFREDVERYLTEHDVRFSPSIGIPGRSGLDQHFHLVIPASRKMPERLVESVNRLDRPRLTSLIFQWTDVVPNRPNADMAVFLNDEEGLREDLVSALHNYGIHTVRWSRRDEHIEQLMN